MSDPIVPIRVSREIERLRSWEGISTPYDLALFMGRVLSIDVTKLTQFQEIVYSDLEPTGADRKKLWIKTNEPIGLGIPTGDLYSMFYKYPPNIPILWVLGEGQLPSYMTRITDEQLTNLSLTKPSNNSFFWVIFYP